jgi:hypothetical protein
VGEVTTDADFFSKCIQSGPVGLSMLIVESNMIMHEIANRLNFSPTRSESPKLFPGKVHQFAVNLAIAAWGQEDKRYAAYGRFRAVATGPRAWA